MVGRVVAKFLLLLILQAPALVSPSFAKPAGDTTDAGFIETFDAPDWSDGWYISNFDMDRFETGWRRRLVSVLPPAVHGYATPALRLQLEPAPSGQKMPFLGAEVQRSGAYGYGRYEVIMQPGRGDGLVSSFFTYTGPYFGDPHTEIDFEFLGKDTTHVHLNLFTDGEDLPARFVPLGFDAAEAPHLYRFDWSPEAVTWSVDGRTLLSVSNAERVIPNLAGKIYLNIWSGGARFADWLKTPDGFLRAEARYFCVSYRPPEDAGPNCSDVVSLSDD